MLRCKAAKETAQSPDHLRSGTSCRQPGRYTAGLIASDKVKKRIAKRPARRNRHQPIRPLLASLKVSGNSCKRPSAITGSSRYHYTSRANRLKHGTSHFVRVRRIKRLLILRSYLIPREIHYTEQRSYILDSITDAKPFTSSPGPSGLVKCSAALYTNLPTNEATIDDDHSRQVSPTPARLAH